MTGTNPSPTARADPRSGRRRTPTGLAVIVLPLLALAGVLVFALLAPGPHTCGGAVPGCASLRNAGELPVTVETLVGQVDGEDERQENVVAAGARVLLTGESNAVRVDAGQCLRVGGGPFWTTVSFTDRVGQDAGQWQVIDDWGARVQLESGRCPTVD